MVQINMESWIKRSLARIFAGEGQAGECLTGEQEQIARIKPKIEKARRKDRKLSVFGARSHKYQMNERLTAEELAKWELKTGVRLPEHFALFLTELGNGGAGPYYGVYDIDKAFLNTIDNQGETEGNHLLEKCSLHPKMTDDEWKSLAAPLIEDEDQDIANDEYDEALRKVFGGMLKFGTQGCTYDMYIVIEGEHRGRIVYTHDHYEHQFFFVRENNFLDWYERWLDDIIADYEMDQFGYRMGGDEATLIDVYKNSADNSVKLDALNGMLKFRKISQATHDFLKNLIEMNENHITALQVVCKSSFETGKAYIQRQLYLENDENFLGLLRILRWYGKDSKNDDMT